MTIWFIKECSDEDNCWCVEIWKIENNIEICIVKSGNVNKETALILVNEYNNEKNNI